MRKFQTKTSRCGSCSHKSHRGHCTRYMCNCSETKPFVNTVIFLPVRHGDRIDLGYGDLMYLGFKPGATKKREGWLVYAVPEHQLYEKPKKLR